MKKQYTAMKAEKIDFGAYDMVTVGSLPGDCIQIVANVVEPGGSKCGNPTSTTSYMYIGDNPGYPDD
jgi:hypothetical protein